MASVKLNSKVVRKETIEGVTVKLSLEEAAFIYGLMGQSYFASPYASTIYHCFNTVMHNASPKVVEKTWGVILEAEKNVKTFVKEFKQSKEMETNVEE